MRKSIYIAIGIALISLASCSSDDSATQANEQQQEQEQPTPEKQYKLYLVHNNINKDSLTFETKTGNGEWRRHELELLRFVVFLNDSVRVTSGTHYIEGGDIYIRLELNNFVDWHDDRNKGFPLSSYDRPLDKKFKVEL